jgi:hypothetical protein
MNSISWFLVISYFDQIIGPSIFYCNDNLDEYNQIELYKLLDFNTKEQCIILANDTYQTINYSFLIESKLSRGGYEQMLISYIINENDIKSEYLDIFKFLRSKQPIIADFAQEIKAFNWLPKILNDRDKIFHETAFDLASGRDQSEFLKKYYKFYELLYPDVRRFETEDWRLIKIECPTCSRSENIRIPSSKINENDRETSIFIPKFKICEHSFIYIINELLQPKDHYLIDITVSDIETESLNIQEIDILLAEKIFDYLKKNGLTRPVSHRKIIKYLYGILHLRVNRGYLDYLCEVVKEHFNTEVIWAKTQALDNLEELWVH